MTPMNNAERFSLLRESVNERLAALLPEGHGPQAELIKAMRYSLFAGGKRVRPILALGFCSACGQDASHALDLGCALELLHTYSLIHDDLPCMDNDELRRGKPTSHVVFGEWLALLAGDALQAKAFETVGRCGLSDGQTAEALRVLARAAGEQGICGGQYLDLSGEGKPRDVAALYTTHSMKTAALIEAACELGCIAAGAGMWEREAARRYGQAVGLAFQIVDDVLDCESSTEALGKTVGKDAASQKTTFVTLYGAERCREMAAENTRLAIDAVENAFEAPEFLIWLAEQLCGRVN